MKYISYFFYHLLIVRSLCVRFVAQIFFFVRCIKKQKKRPPNKETSEREK